MFTIDDVCQLCSTDPVWLGRKLISKLFPSSAMTIRNCMTATAAWWYSNTLISSLADQFVKDESVIVPAVYPRKVEGDWRVKVKGKDKVITMTVSPVIRYRTDARVRIIFDSHSRIPPSLKSLGIRELDFGSWELNQNLVRDPTGKAGNESNSHLCLISRVYSVIYCTERHWLNHHNYQEITYAIWFRICSM